MCLGKPVVKSVKGLPPCKSGQWDNFIGKVQGTHDINVRNLNFNKKIGFAVLQTTKLPVLPYCNPFHPISISNNITLNHSVSGYI